MLAHAAARARCGGALVLETGAALPDAITAKKRIPTKPLVRDLFKDEEPEESYHNLREQDEEGNFIHSSDEDKDQGAQVEEDPQPSPQQQQGHRRRKEGRRSVPSSPQ